MKLEIERLKKLQTPQMEQLNQAQSNNLTFRKLLKALQQARRVIDNMPTTTTT